MFLRCPLFSFFFVLSGFLTKQVRSYFFPGGLVVDSSQCCTVSLNILGFFFVPWA
jgi:hypothetical protein